MLRTLILLCAVTAGFTNLAGPQVPRNGSQQHNDSQKDADSSKVGQPLPTALAQTNPTNEQKQTSPKPYQWRELYAPANIPNWVLAILAGLAGYLAWRTLEAIKKQVEWMKTQAVQMALQLEQMEGQNKIAQDRERARLAIRAVETPELFPMAQDLRAVIVSLFVANEGITKAFEVRAFGIMKIVKSPNGDVYEPGFRQDIITTIPNTDTEKYLPKVTLTGIGSQIGVFDSQLGNSTVITQATVQNLTQRMEFVQVTGVFLYKDLFGQSQSLPFHYVWIPWGDNMRGQWPDQSYWHDLSLAPDRIEPQNQ